MFKILLAVDSDKERALAGVDSIVSLPDAPQSLHVTIINVQENVAVADEASIVSSEDWYDEKDFPLSAEKSKEKLERNNISVEMRREHGDPTEQIINVSEEIDADRIVVSGRKRSPTGKVLFGSITQSVLLESDIPVTVTTI